MNNGNDHSLASGPGPSRRAVLSGGAAMLAAIGAGARALGEPRAAHGLPAARQLVVPQGPGCLVDRQLGRYVPLRGGHDAVPERARRVPGQRRSSPGHPRPVDRLVKPVPSAVRHVRECGHRPGVLEQSHELPRRERGRHLRAGLARRDRAAGVQPDRPRRLPRQHGRSLFGQQAGYPVLHAAAAGLHDVLPVQRGDQHPREQRRLRPHPVGRFPLRLPPGRVGRAVAVGGCDDERDDQLPGAAGPLSRAGRSRRRDRHRERGEPAARRHGRRHDRQAGRPDRPRQRDLPERRRRRRRRDGRHDHEHARPDDRGVRLRILAFQHRERRRFLRSASP